MGRRRELAIRTALGGSRAALLTQHLTETLLLSIAGGALGLFLAYGMVQWFVRLRQDVPRVDSIHIDGVVLVFCVGLIVLSAVFAGLVSAFSSRGDLVLNALQESSRSHSGGQSRARLRRLLLTVEVGLTVVLLIGAGLLLKSYARLRSSDLGCVTHNVLTMQFSLPAARYDFPATVHFYQELLARVRQYPGVQAAGLVTTLPGDGYDGDTGFTVQGQPLLPQKKGQLALTRWVDPGYFAAIGIPFESGHTFDDDQLLATGSQVIISSAMQRQYFPGKDPVGATILTHGERPYRIAGVVGDTLFSLGEQVQPMIYFPIYTLDSNNPKDFNPRAALVVRSGQDVAQFALPVQRIFQSLDRDLAVSAHSHHGSGDWRADSGLQLRRDPAADFRARFLTAGLRGTIRSHLLHRCSTDDGDRCADCAWGTTQSSIGPHPARWAASSLHRRGPRTRCQLGNYTVDSVDALPDAAPRSGNLQPGRVDANRSGRCGLLDPRMAGRAIRSGVGAENGVNCRSTVEISEV